MFVKNNLKLNQPKFRKIDKKKYDKIFYCMLRVEMLETFLMDDKRAEMFARSPPGWNKTDVTGFLDSVSMTAMGLLK